MQSYYVTTYLMQSYYVIGLHQGTDYLINGLEPHPFLQYHRFQEVSLRASETSSQIALEILGAQANLD